MQPKNKHPYLLAMLMTVLSISFFATESAFAQQGSIMLYGSAGYHNVKDQFREVHLNPLGVGYQFNNNVIAGGNFVYSRQKNEAGGPAENHYEAGPFYSYGVQVGEHFVIFGQADAHYQWGNHQTDLSASEDYDGYMLRLYPAVAIGLGHGWAFKSTFGLASYGRTKDKDTGHVDRDLNIGLNGSTVGVGVSKNIVFKKRDS
ncbi:MAG TPA: hypothetical protein VIG72_03460 [Pontibacter sp.]